MDAAGLPTLLDAIRRMHGCEARWAVDPGPVLEPEALGFLELCVFLYCATIAAWTAVLASTTGLRPSTATNFRFVPSVA